MNWITRRYVTNTRIKLDKKMSSGKQKITQRYILYHSELPKGQRAKDLDKRITKCIPTYEQNR